MGYTMHFKVDGGCRGNGYSNAIGAAAAVQVTRGQFLTWTRHLPGHPVPTNQRVEITAIIMVLELALERYHNLDSYPRLYLTIQSDSRYAVNCMNVWIYKWHNNGWVNSAGNEVANRDLIEKASRLDDQVAELGSVTYEWIPRADNEEADEACNEALDEQE